MPMDVAPDVPVALPEAPAAAPEAPMQIDVAPEAPAPALEVASARERAKYEQMQLNLRQNADSSTEDIISSSEHKDT